MQAYDQFYFSFLAIMTSLQFVEDGELSGTRITSDGYLVANVRCARTGIQDYAGYEFGVDKERIRVYRPESEVFSTDSLTSFAGKPATDNHPSEPVTAANWRQHAVGSIGSEVLRDGEFIRVPLTLMDADIIEKVQNGKREISMGYTLDLDFTAGKTPDGQAYDAVMRSLKMNHLAIVDKGRAGPSVRIGDNWGEPPTLNDGKPTMTLKTIVVDGLPVETTDAGEAAIKKLQAETKAAKDATSAAQVAHQNDAAAKQATHDAEVKDLNGKLATKDAEIVELKAKVLDDAALDARVAARAALMTKAGKIAKDAKFTGKSDTEIKSMAVDAVHGDGFSKDKAQAYIDVAFDLLKEPEGAGDTVRDALIRDKRVNQPEDNSYDKHVAWLGDAYKGETA